MKLYENTKQNIGYRIVTNGYFAHSSLICLKALQYQGLKLFLSPGAFSIYPGMSGCSAKIL